MTQHSISKSCLSIVFVCWPKTGLTRLASIAHDPCDPVGPFDILTGQASKIFLEISQHHPIEIG